ncbi:MAG: hypothetical protein HZA01_12585 [Nitrospinae bacterium]|nr:hypothetical protein [Nitrospinota bacterium]
MNNSESTSLLINFRTQGDWGASDVLTLVSSAAKIYDAFLAVEIQRRREEENFEAMERSMKRMHKYMDHPMSRDFYHIWRDYIQMWREEKIMLPYPPPLPFPFAHDIAEKPSMAFDIYLDIESYTSDENRLRVRRIHIASPGDFSFSGIGEIIREIRELIKDIWFRNKQDKIKGELDIIDKYLTMRRKNSNLNIPSPRSADKKLVKVVQEKIHSLRTLENEGKLLSVPENIESEKK